MQRACDSCGQQYETKRATSRFCGERCKKRAQRGHVIDMRDTRPATPVVTGLTAATRSELEEAGRAETALGQAALALAARIESGADTGSAVASLTREGRATLEAATANAARAASPLDELRSRRAKRLGA